MNLGENQNRNVLIAGVLLLMLPFFVIAALVAFDPRSQANPQAVPQRVQISNITGTSATVSYVTEAAVTGSATANAASGGSSGSGGDFRDDAGSEGEYRVHYITISNLSPETEYSVSILSDGTQYSEDAWTFRTGSIGDLGVPSSVFGRVTAPGLSEGLVYAVAGDSSGNTRVASTLMQNETFVIDRNNFGIPVGQLDGKDMIIYVDALGLGRAKAQFPTDQSSVGNLELSSAEIFFDEEETITPGGQPDLSEGQPTPPPPPQEPTDPAPAPIETDQISEQILTEIYSSGAETESPIAPYNIFISNLGPTGFTVNWMTKEPTTGYLEILEDGQVSRIVDPRDGNINNLSPRFTHSATASSGAIPAGTAFEFQIISQNVAFGTDIQDTVAVINAQFSEFAESDDIDDSQFIAETPNIVANPYTVLIPAATDSPPLPIAFQGKLESSIGAEDYDRIVAAARSRSLGLRVADLERDAIVAVRSPNSLFVSDIVSANDTFSLSIGTMLTQAQNNFVSVSNGDSLEVAAFSAFAQFSNTTETYQDDSTYNLTTSGGGVIIAPTAYTVQREGLVVGISESGTTPEVDINGSISSSSSRSGGWQVTSNSFLAGENQVSLLDSNDRTQDSRIFIINPEILPVTALDANTIRLLIGTGLLGLGVFIYLRYWRWRELSS